MSEPTPAEVAALIEEIGTGLRARESEVIKEMTYRLLHENDFTRADPRMEKMRIAAIHSNVVTMIEILANNISLENMQPPIAAVESARRAAQREIPSNLLVRSYHMGQNSIMRTLHEEVERRNLPVDLGLAVVKQLNDRIYAYADWITSFVFETYEAERVRWINARGSVNSSTVQALLSAATPAAAFEETTGYRLDRTHLAVVLWYTGGDESTVLSMLGSAARVLARDLQTDGPPLVTAVDRRTAWAWLPFGDHQPVVEVPESWVGEGIPAGVQLAAGLPLRGLAGFRRSHQQAEATYRVATVPDAPHSRRTMGFGDPGVAIVSLLTHNLDATREWVREVLGELAYDAEQTAPLRDTLSTYYSTGESHVHTAQQMILHRNTVKYRVTRALELIRDGGTPHSKLDIAVALEVCRLLGRKVLRAPRR
ncbi:PucR family transcriptional regulator [Nocardia mangyaensis]|uniref:PucR family transcriptional regulator n=1 Tax=Nocardia mangyaensis TaxID=2213200 RepID=UPI002675A312|nr:helix-turn-helix domain-containing protein [Nocardia mangyaensis]MDO3648243.1 helix-turn-helix domain-containing protein [Nocardia mangyaensis]